MADGVAVDANVMKRFRADLVESADGASRILVEGVLAQHGLVLDLGGKILHEWFTQCAGDLFKEWFYQNMKDGRIRLVKPVLDPGNKNHLVQKLGFPKQGYDLTYVSVANATTKRYIVTEDMDFFDPKQKCADNATKERIKRERKAPVCAYLRKEMKITVGTTAQALNELLGPHNIASM